MLAQVAGAAACAYYERETVECFARILFGSESRVVFISCGFDEESSKFIKCTIVWNAFLSVDFLGQRSQPIKVSSAVICPHLDFFNSPSNSLGFNPGCR